MAKRKEKKRIDEDVLEDDTEAVEAVGIVAFTDLPKDVKRELKAIADRHAPENEVDQHLLSDRIKRVMKSLPYQDREILKLRFGLEDGYSYTLEEVGHIFKCTREHIRHLEAKAVRRLQQPKRSQELVGFLD